MGQRNREQHIQQYPICEDEGITEEIYMARPRNSEVMIRNFRKEALPHPHENWYENEHGDGHDLHLFSAHFRLFFHQFRLNLLQFFYLVGIVF